MLNSLAFSQIYVKQSARTCIDVIDFSDSIYVRAYLSDCLSVYLFVYLTDLPVPLGKTLWLSLGIRSSTAKLSHKHVEHHSNSCDQHTKIVVPHH